MPESLVTEKALQRRYWRLRYQTPVGPIRIDYGQNVDGIKGVKSHQIFITIGQAF